ncbi:hypothetical protein [Psychroflexus sp. MES1-P1E]|uniref:hypothetical protein n=1 Tax=Psychroflexus sp. MES1-P1E TaxID=2058320 RepID=UPI000C7E6710|nr:hypothetical protein [Psychroflexus sp. MES1-P1E]PKG42627.1 hypothetical protein CXF67_09280 [Psychroflexus sp. MES1-P1E]
MVITEIRNRNEAESFIELLKNTSISYSTERPFSVHFFFFTTGLEIEESKLILESIVELDKVSGSHIACHIFVDKIKTSIFETLSGIYERKPIEGRDFTLTQIEGLCNNESLNHMQLDKLEPADLTNATEHIARGLGISEKLPCILIFDSTEMLLSDELTILEFPDTRKDLSTLLRKFLGIIQSNSEIFRKNTEILDEINNLFDKQKAIRTKRGAPTEHKMKVLNNFFKKEFNSLEDGLKESNRIRKKILNNDTIQKEQFGLVVQSKFASRGKNSAEEVKKLLAKVKKDGDEMDSELATVNHRISELKSSLKFSESVSKIFRKDKLLNKYTDTVKTSMADIIKTGIKELGKPSFWLKILGP